MPEKLEPEFSEVLDALKKKKDEFKSKYGDKWEEVMYATATKVAKNKKGLSENIMTFGEFQLNESKRNVRVYASLEGLSVSRMGNDGKYFVGNMGIKGTSSIFDLYGMDSKEISYTKNSLTQGLKPDEIVVRYVTYNSRAGGISPLVKINLSRGLVYFLTEESSSGVTEDVTFENRGTPLTYLNLDASQASYILGTPKITE